MVRPRIDAPPGEGPSATAPRLFTVLTLATVLAVAVPIAAQASPAALTVADVRELITRRDCGGVSDSTPEGVVLREHLVAKVTHESGRDPYAIRVEDENRALPPIAAKDAAVREAMRRLEAGQTLGLGLPQITHKENLARDFGVRDWREAVPMAFEPCAAVRAMVRHYAADLDRTARVLDCASGAYNRGTVACRTGYARSIAAIRAALPVRPPVFVPPAPGGSPVRDVVQAPPEPPPPDPDEPPAWDAWAHDEWERARSETAAPRGGARTPPRPEPDPSDSWDRPVVEPDPRTRAASAGGAGHPTSPAVAERSVPQGGAAEAAPRGNPAARAKGGGPARSPLTVREVAPDEEDQQP